MPIYEYTCLGCGKAFQELIMSRAEAENVKCPHCESGKVEKALSSFAVGAGSSGGDLPCDSGECETPTCAGGTCPFSG
jgi:putative FmdB family regulatory protein